MTKNWTPPLGQTPNYMNGGWNTHQTSRTADKVDHIADKASFAVDMINNALIGFDGIEKELMELSSASNPPQPETLRIMAHRIDTYQKQVQNGLFNLKKFMEDIDKATDNIQRNSDWKY
ncbi:hypothetical protein CN491_23930 [Bacillus cereus]|jgi:hypothetical protein|uniref:Uncharacterized protein n=1 Tax=Bacillus cereus TaxID=1396 RepID=A0A2B2FW16_BACCE|nr:MULTISPECIES: hypothetical protein [Bacillus cereus group]MDR4982517.1 hypothetical protein [Bacillus cereus]MEA1012177.1 hypothetical protein [Bacillus cereus]PES90697.1 hypothetical protein CN491_23930 [Bacillus cereus]PFP73907.1 hypothetical protein COJ95_20955 [Bacillus cereus]PGT18073.1 hypothetical protein COC96_14305 [Bacillus cereus]